MSVLGLSLSY